MKNLNVVMTLIAVIVFMALLGRASGYSFAPSTSDDTYVNNGNFMITMQSRV